MPNPSTPHPSDSVPYVQCEHCLYWHPPDSPHATTDCVENFRAIIRNHQRELYETKVRANIAEDALEEIRRVPRDA